MYVAHHGMLCAVIGQDRETIIKKALQIGAALSRAEVLKFEVKGASRNFYFSEGVALVSLSSG